MHRAVGEDVDRLPLQMAQAAHDRCRRARVGQAAVHEESVGGICELPRRHALDVAHSLPVDRAPDDAVNPILAPLRHHVSARILAILREVVPRVESYSIDESFLDLTGIPERAAFCRELRNRIYRWTGIPSCVGIGATKTLAKLGNLVAKTATRKPGSYPAALGGVADLSALSPPALVEVLAATPVGELWGVGPRWAAKLRGMGIETRCNCALRVTTTSALSWGALRGILEPPDWPLPMTWPGSRRPLK